jgi:hypothetical protein
MNITGAYARHLRFAWSARVDLLAVRNQPIVGS